MDTSRLSPQLQALVGRAMTDARFRTALFSDVRGTLSNEGITLDEPTIQAIEHVVSDAAARKVGDSFDEVMMRRAAYVT